ncbi:glycosyltransferase [Reichenbachiella agariperforans]|uniref:Alpha-1,6-mannosyltransferase n=2 Tax=Reichenbachiella agariperforans TaxID=156994 RepID=A0A1M6UZZ6_REIAG|nr:glycosyltransferase [Reichenbachiella agariperforans]MBU2912405.1 glycosyltransferase [Reichenbachiella agariperforans]SHK74758.1 alpha-1,6-mannosyltransferase [Reichenbachiella agariperforans]
MFTLVDCNNFWSPSGGGVRRYHLEKMEYFKDRADVKYVFVMHDSETYTEQIGSNAYIEHLKVPKVFGNWEYRYLTNSDRIAPLLVKHDPDAIEVGSPYIMPRIVNNVVTKHHLKARVYGFWHADFPVTYVKRFLSGLPFSLDQRGEELAWAYARKNYNRMTGVLASSEIILDRMKLNGIENTHFVPLGVNEVLFNPDKKDLSLVEELKAGDSNRLVMFFPHRFCKEKGLDVLLDAYPILCEKLNVEPTLVLAGMGPDIKRVQLAAEKYEHVHFKGFIQSKEEMATYYASADLGFALSAWETFGLSLVEALSAGLPLIAAGDGAAKEHIDRSGAGYVLDTVTPENLAEMIVAFVNSSERVSFKVKAREYAKHLNWKNCFDKLLRIYQES